MLDYKIRERVLAVVERLNENLIDQTSYLCAKTMFKQALKHAAPALSLRDLVNTAQKFINDELQRDWGHNFDAFLQDVVRVNRCRCFSHIAPELVDKRELL